MFLSESLSPFAEGKIELLIRNQPSVSEQSEAARMWNALRDVVFTLACLLI